MQRAILLFLNFSFETIEFNRKKTASLSESSGLLQMTGPANRKISSLLELSKIPHMPAL